MSDLLARLPRSLQPLLASARRFVDTGNLLRFLVSMVLAFGLWAWVTYENDPETTRVLLGIPVTLANLEESFEIVGEVPTVDVIVQGPQSIVGPLERERVVATADLSGIEGIGTYEFEIEVDAPSGIRVTDVVPEEITIEIDQMQSLDDVPVSLIEPDDIPPNYQVRDIELEPETLTVSGPARSLDLIDRAEVAVQISGRTSSFTDSIEPVVLDANGNEIPGIQVEPADVSVAVTLDVRGQLRKVIPVIVGDDALAPGHELVRTTALPTDEIVVDGPDEDLANIFYLTTVPIDIAGWSESRIVRDVGLDMSRLPPDVSIDTEAIHVSIEIRQQTHQREISGLPISVMNAAPGTEVILASEIATVTLEGSQSAVEATGPEDITVFVNVASADPGEYEFELGVIVPAQVQYREIEPQFVEVTILDESVDPENDEDSPDGEGNQANATQ